MLNHAQVEEFRLNGFLLGGKILDADEVGVLREELARVIKEQDTPVPQPVRVVNLSRDEMSPVWQIVNIWQASDPFRRLVHNPRIVGEIAQLTRADELRIWHDQIQYKPPEVGGVNGWHQDSPYWPILSPKTSQVTAWVALDDVDESNGCMRMVAQSYLWGNQIEFLHTLKELDIMPPSFAGNSIEVKLCPVRKGHVHYHHSLTWHASHANTSGNPRRAIGIHYMTSETRYDANGDHPMKRFVTVPDGEKLAGKVFPLVMDNDSPVNPYYPAKAI
jgi:ectoine hydroxylase-related dioxygenase (phytanoyl-CoA dioxygenase family)